MSEFPDMKGLETRNLRRMKQWYLAYSQEDLIRTQLVPELVVDTKRKQLVSQFEDVFFSVPWGHHILIMQRCKDIDKAFLYIQQTVENSWSRNVLDWQINSNLT